NVEAAAHEVIDSERQTFYVLAVRPHPEVNVLRLARFRVEEVRVPTDQDELHASLVHGAREGYEVLVHGSGR
ncbi:MAG TPA: hypothetical protein VNT60_11335, partial [Deinococcales bacterium]|nr:hypothetical protein [Deinococcales bacterium]